MIIGTTIAAGVAGFVSFFVACWVGLVAGTTLVETDSGILLGPIFEALAGISVATLIFRRIRH